MCTPKWVNSDFPSRKENAAQWRTERCSVPVKSALTSFLSLEIQPSSVCPAGDNTGTGHWLVRCSFWLVERSDRSLNSTEWTAPSKAVPGEPRALRILGYSLALREHWSSQGCENHHGSEDCRHGESSMDQGVFVISPTFSSVGL